MKPVTITDVAKHAGVSKSTVSQFLNQRYEYMGEKTKSRIHAAIEELGYSPNIVARSLKQKSTMTIGVIVANILHVFSTQVVRAIEDYCNQSDFHVIVCNADDDPMKEKRYIEMLRAKQVDGIIAFPTGENTGLYKGLIKEKYPLVFVDRMVPGVPISSVLLDNEQASILAVEEFLRHGYKKIGMITPPADKQIVPRIERIQGYRSTLNKHGISVHPDYVSSTPIGGIQGALEKMLTLPDPPDALLAMNDRALFEILKYVHAHSISIPDQLALIGIDDIAFAGFFSPSLTTVAQPAFDMGKKAAGLLLEQIRNKDKPVHPEVYRFEPQLIIRMSC